MAIRIKKDGSTESGIVDDNVVQPFRLEQSNVRGRMVRLGSVLNEIMARHDYPPPVSALLSEVLTLCLMLSAMLKYEGVFSLQVKGEGAIKALVADVTSKGEVRAYASFNEDAVKAVARRKQDTEHHYYHLLGKGYMAFNVQSDIQAEHSSYQGIVALQGKSILEDVEHYFAQSEQIKTSFKLAVHPQDSYWRAGGIMIQHMPAEGGRTVEDMEDGEEEDWNRARVLLSTCKEGEILSPVLHSADVLYRLFHEDGVRVYAPKPVRFACRCSHEKVVNMLRSIPREEVEDICEQEGGVHITCEFCSRQYHFSPEDVQDLYKEND